MKKKILLALLCLQTVLLTGCNEPISKSDFMLDTIVEITIYDSSDESLLTGSMDLCKKYENLFSKTIETSDISRINEAHGTPVTVSSDTISILSVGMKYSQLSDGAFDLSIAPASNLWDFKSENPSPPSKTAVSEALMHINYKNIIISGNTVSLKDPEAKIDLGGIAKGYIADRIKDYLVSEGVKSAVINLGCNILTIGQKPDHTPFNVGIRAPFKDQNTVICAVPVDGLSVVSSGPYERYFEYEGTLYHHILDPATGYPTTNNLAGVSIISPLSVDGDALSTTCFVLGLEKGTELINSLDPIEAIFITSDNQVFYTDPSMKEQ